LTLPRASQYFISEGIEINKLKTQMSNLKTKLMEYRSQEPSAAGGRIKTVFLLNSIF